MMRVIVFAIAFAVGLALFGCTTVEYVDRVRTVTIEVPSPAQPIPAELLQDCPSEGEWKTAGHAIDWLQQCVTLLKDQRQRLAEMAASR